MKAIVWSKINCPYCVSAGVLLRSNGYEVEERKVGSGWTKEQLLEAVPTARSVPQIFVNGEFVGGYEDLVQLFKKDKAEADSEPSVD
jgi:glutaredoxin 3